MKQPIPVRSLLDLSGKVAIVTGAGRGIGRTIAARLAEAGAATVVHHHTAREEAARAVAELCAAGRRAVAVEADLTERSGAERLIATAIAELGAIDVLVNNAGIYPLKPLLDLEDTDWERVVDANLKSAFLTTQVAAREMIARGRPGAIVNITSIEAFDPAPLHAHYNAAKGGLTMLTRAAALELGAAGIRVNAVAPGLIDKGGLENDWPDGVKRYLAAVPLGRLGCPADVADACLFLASPAARWITGTTLVVDGGITSTQSF